MLGFQDAGEEKLNHLIEKLIFVLEQKISIQFEKKLRCRLHRVTIAAYVHNTKTYKPKPTNHAQLVSSARKA
jgi:hypothetical protein